MEPVRPEFAPDPALSREEMDAVQRDIAAAATFTDDFDFDVAAIHHNNIREKTLGGAGEVGNRQVLDAGAVEDRRPLVAGVDQAFVDDVAVSAIVLTRGDEIIERVHAAVETEIPYIPGLLSFREGGAILAAFEHLNGTPDLALVDGSGRIHFREAGLATHVGVVLDMPTVGVAKSLLCGTPRESLDRRLPVGTRIEVEADDSVETTDPGTLIGHAVQTRQYESENRSINPLYVSPGHRISAETAADIVLACRAGYKLPEPTRLADSYADEVKAEVRTQHD